MTTVALPKTPAEWDHYLSGLDTPEKFVEAMNDKENGFKPALKSYVDTQTNPSADLQRTVAELTQASLTEFLKENGIKPDAARPALAGTAKPKGSKRAVGAGLNGEFEDLGEFVQAIWHKRTEGTVRFPNNKELNAQLEILNAYQEKVPSDGGFLVPEEFRTEIMSTALESAIVRPRAMVIPMGTNTLSFPTVDATSNVSTVFGGIVVYRTEEGAEFVESQAKFARIKLDVTKQTALAYVTNETIKDTGGALMAWLGQNLPAAMSWFEDLDYINGTGAGEPLGVLNAANPALTVVAKRSGQTTATILWENAIDMYSRVLPQSIGSAVWLASPDTFVELATMALNVGTGGSAVWLTDAHGTPVLTLLGRPIVMTEKTPGVLGAQSDLSLIDFSKYMIGDRESLSIETSAHVKFTSDQTTIRAIQRNDGRPAVLSAITPQNSGPTLSPFVTLGARP
jgi:HK97 family phage major capsid protein